MQLLAKIQCYDKNTDNRNNLTTVWKVINLSSSQGEVISKLSLVGFSDFQRKPRFGSKITERVVDLQNKAADFSNILSFMFCGF